MIATHDLEFFWSSMGHLFKGLWHLFGTMAHLVKLLRIFLGGYGWSRHMTLNCLGSLWVIFSKELEFFFGTMGHLVKLLRIFLGHMVDRNTWLWIFLVTYGSSFQMNLNFFGHLWVIFSNDFDIFSQLWVILSNYLEYFWEVWLIVTHDFEFF